MHAHDYLGAALRLKILSRQIQHALFQSKSLILNSLLQTNITK
jgi:tRNA pseudouridine-54 N-methylase